MKVSLFNRNGAQLDLLEFWAEKTRTKLERKTQCIKKTKNAGEQTEIYYQENTR